MFLRSGSSVLMHLSSGPVLFLRDAMAKKVAKKEGARSLGLKGGVLEVQGVQNFNTFENVFLRSLDPSTATLAQPGLVGLLEGPSAPFTRIELPFNKVTEMA